jgi:hypothetical protein
MLYISSMRCLAFRGINGRFRSLEGIITIRNLYMGSIIFSRLSFTINLPLYDDYRSWKL